jgi:hypothetical protein
MTPMLASSSVAHRTAVLVSVEPGAKASKAIGEEDGPDQAGPSDTE